MTKIEKIRKACSASIATSTTNLALFLLLGQWFTISDGNFIEQMAEHLLFFIDTTIWYLFFFSTWFLIVSGNKKLFAPTRSEIFCLLAGAAQPGIVMLLSVSNSNIPKTLFFAMERWTGMTPGILQICSGTLATFLVLSIPSRLNQRSKEGTN